MRAGRDEKRALVAHRHGRLHLEKEAPASLCSKDVGPLVDGGHAGVEPVKEQLAGHRMLAGPAVEEDPAGRVGRRPSRAAARARRPLLVEPEPLAAPDEIGAKPRRRTSAESTAFMIRSGDCVVWPGSKSPRCTAFSAISAAVSSLYPSDSASIADFLKGCATARPRAPGIQVAPGAGRSPGRAPTISTIRGRQARAGPRLRNARGSVDQPAALPASLATKPHQTCLKNGARGRSAWGYPECISIRIICWR